MAAIIPVIPTGPMGPMMVARPLTLPLPARLLLGVLDAHGCQKLPPLDGVVHHRFVCLLLLPFDRQKRIVPDLRSHVPGVVDGWHNSNTFLAGLLGELAHLVVLDELVDAPLPEKVGLGFGRVARLAIGRT